MGKFIPFSHILTAYLVIFFAFFLQITNAQTLPSGFYLENIASGATFARPVTVEFTPDGRIFIAEKDGIIYVVEDGVKLPTPLLDIKDKVLANEERGLIGMVLDPDFAQNRYVYVLYSVDLEGNDQSIPGYGRISRYTVDSANPNILDPNSEFILIGNNFSDGLPHCLGQHIAGSLHFGADGSLLVSVGDNATGNGADNGGLQEDCFGDGLNDVSDDIGAYRAQKITSYSGKILRINSANGHGYPSNPFYTGNPEDIQSKVWAYGLRNPFRFSVRQDGDTEVNNGKPGTLFIGDVGWYVSEELNISIGGENFGWPCYEGTELQASYKNAPPSAYGCNTIGTVENPGPLKEPFLKWDHPEGGASIAGDFYTGGKYPVEYRGRLFQADYQERWVKAFELNPDLTLNNTIDFSTNFSEIVEVKYDKYSEYIYFVQLGGSVKRLRHNQESDNSAPIAEVSATPTFGSAPLEVSFTGSNSFDPDGDILTYLWDFGDGNSSTTANPAHTYNQVGDYDVKLTVFDPNGESSFSSIKISVGNSAPVASIISPKNGENVFVNQELILESTATDDSDDISQLNFRWEVTLIHNTHEHPNYFTSNNQNTSLLIDQHGISNEVNYLKLELLVTDAGGLTDTVTQYVVVSNNDLTNATQEGTPIAFNETPLAGGGLEVIYDGEFPEEGSSDINKQYNSKSAQGNSSFDWVGFAFSEERYFSRIIFQEGIHSAAGGFFNTLSVEVRKDNNWTNVQNLNIVKRYEGDNGNNFDTYTLLFEAQVGDAIRIIGDPGGDEEFISIGELNVYTLPFGNSFTLNPIEDAYTNNSFGDTNYGDKGQLLVRDKSTYGYVSLIKFDVSKIASLTNAILRIYGQNADNARSFDLDIYSIPDNWVENEITYNSLPPQGSLITSFQVTQSNEYYQVDLTNYILSQVEGDGTASILLTSNSGNYDKAIFRSREDASSPPELIIFGEVVQELQDQTITFDPMNDVTTDITQFLLQASSSSGLPISFSVVSGPASILNDTIVLDGTPGQVTVKASQPGNNEYKPAEDVTRSFEVVSLLGPPAITLLSPLDGDTIVGSEVQILYELSGDLAGYGADHLHFMMDGPPHITVKDLSGQFTFTDVLPGNHTVMIQLVNIGHVPLTNPEATVQFDIVTYIPKQTQTISFSPIEDKFTTDVPFTLIANSTSGLNVSYEVISGPASVSANTITLTGVEGTVTVEASQLGDSIYDAAIPVRQSFQVSTPIVQSQLYELAPIADAYTNNAGAYADENYGDKQKLLIRNRSNWGYSSYLRFDLSQYAEITKATLKLFGSTERGNPVNIGLFPLSDNWEELGINNNNAPVPDSGLITSIEIPTSEDYYEIDVTSYIQTELSKDWLASFALVSLNSEDDQAGFRSKESGPSGPMLVLEGTLDSTIAQTISFGTLSDKYIYDVPFELNASSSSGLEVSYSVISGPANIEGNMLTLTGDTGTVIIEATQIGNDSFRTAIPVQRSFKVVSFEVNFVSIDIDPIHDSYTNNANAYRDENYGSKQKVYVRNRNSWGYKGYLSFDLNQFDKIERAYLRLFGKTESGVPVKVGIYGLIDNWSEDLITFNNAPTEDSILLGSFIAFNNDQEYFIDLTSYINLEYNQDKIASLALISLNTEDDRAGFNSKESGPTGPILMIQGEELLKSNQVISFDSISDKFRTDPPFLVNVTSSSGLAVEVNIVSGPALANGNEIVLTGDTGLVVVEASQNGNFQYNPAIPVQRSFKVELEPLSGDSLFLAPIADSYTNNSPTYSSQNYGEKKKMYVRNRSSWGYRSFIRFDLRQVPVVEQAVLRIYSSTESGNSVKLGIFGISDNWQEDEINYLNAPPIDTSLIQSFDIPTVEDYYDIEITSYIKDEFLKDQFASIALVSLNDSDDNVGIRSRENGPSGPSLIILTQEINKASQTIVFEPITDKLNTDAPFDIIASASSGLPVSFRVISGPATVLGNTASLTGLTGTVTIEAYQEGNNIFNPAPNIRQSFEVTEQLPQTITFDPIADKKRSDAPFDITATSSSGLPVTLDVISGPATIEGNTVTLSGQVGMVTVEATQSGNSEYLVAQAVERSFEVTDLLPQTITFDPIADKKRSDAPFDITATSSSGLPVTLDVISGPATIVGNTITLSGQVGTVTIEATQSGNSEYLVAQAVERSFEVTDLLPQTITFDPIADKKRTDVPFDLTATSSSGLPVTLDVISGPATIEGNTVTLSGQVGTVTIEATQSGNSEYLVAQAVERSFEVTDLLPQTITFDPIADKKRTDVPFDLTATSSSGLPVTLDVISGPATIEGNTVTLSGQVGTVTVEATQSGNSEYLVAQAVERSFEVTDLLPQTITFDPIADKKRTDVPFDLTATSSSGLPVTLDVISGPATIEGNTVTLSGQVGTVTVEATQSGNSEYLVAQAVERSFEVTDLLPQTITFDPVQDKTTADAPFSISATASSGLPVTYQVISGPATILGSVVTLDGTPGTVIVEATQSGDDTYKAAIPVNQSFLVVEDGCSNTGQVKAEYWYNISGAFISNIPINETPDEIKTFDNFEIESNLTDNYGVRIRGYICPPITGNYVFYISSNNQGAIYLSTDESPQNTSLTAYVYNYTNFRDWYRFSTQESNPIYLEENNQYYIEVYVKEDRYTDHLSVGWELPDNTTELPMPGTRFIPYEGISSGAQLNISNANIHTFDEEDVEIFEPEVDIYPNPFEDELFVEVKDFSDKSVRIRLINILGKEIWRGIGKTNEIISINQEISAGLYFIKIEYDDIVLGEFKVIKQD